MLHQHTATNNNTILFVITIVTGECTMLYEKYDLRFVGLFLIFIQLIIKFLSIYPASTHSDNQQHN